MKFEFTDNETNDTWVEEYPSLAHIPPEDLEGCTYKFLFNCTGCNKEIKTNKISEITIGLCEYCVVVMDEHIEGDEDNE